MGTACCGVARRRWHSGLIAGALLLGVAARPASAQEGERRTGLIPSSSFELEMATVAAAPFSMDPLPPSVDLTSHLPRPGYQGGQNSCVGWAVAYGLKTYQEKVEEGWDASTPDHQFSPAFVYNQINHGEDDGAAFTEALDLVKARGCATLAWMPYDEKDHTSQPSADVKKKARPFSIASAGRLKARGTDDIKGFLAVGVPILIGAEVDVGFRNAAWQDKTWRKREGKSIGRHAMLVVGYDEEKKSFRILNSWGTGWCDGGYCWVTYAHLRTVVFEAWRTVDGSNGGAKYGSSAETPETVAVTSVAEDAEGPSGVGRGVRIEGTVLVPPGQAPDAKVVLFFHEDGWLDSKGPGLRGTEKGFRDGAGRFVALTQDFTAAGGARDAGKRWSVFVPHGVLRGALPGGTSGEAPASIVAVPTLVVGGFAVATGLETRISFPAADSK